MSSPTYGSGPWGANVCLPPQPSPYLRKDFTAAKPIASARLYVSALGLYEVRINGRRSATTCSRRAGRSTPSASRTQTYDVTDLLRRGDNAIGAMLGDGWYAGRLAGRPQVGHDPALLAQLKITYADGTPPDRHRRHLAGRPRRPAARRASTTARPTTPASTSPAGTAPASHGAGPTRPSAPRRWPSSPRRRRRSAPSTRSGPAAHASPSPGPTSSTSARTSPAGRACGVTGRAGTTVKLRFGEILNPDGTLYTANLRCAPRPTRYTLKAAAPRPTSRASPTTASATSR